MTRAPTHSIEAEQSVLGAILLDNRAHDRVADILTQSSFWHAPHGLIFGRVGAMIAAGHPADVVTAHEALRGAAGVGECGSLAYLNALVQSVPSSANVRRYAQIVAQHAASRALADAAAAAVEIAGGAGTTAEKLDRIQTRFGELNRQQAGKAPRIMVELATERTAHYEALANGEEPAGWSTGIPLLDELLGRLRAGGVYILAARPKRGKSSLAQSIALATASQGLPTLVLSMEMPDVEVADRAVAMAGRVNYSALRSGRMEHDDWTGVTDALEHLAPLPLYVDDSPGLTLSALRSKVRTVKGLRVLVIDYLQLMSGARGEDNRNAQLESITRGLKVLAKTDGIAILALSQLNREVDRRPDGRPQLSDLRDSGSIEQDADAVMFLWKAREFADGRRVIGLDVAANRQGPTGVVALDFWGAQQRWAQSADEITTASGRSRPKDDL